MHFIRDVPMPAYVLNDMQNFHMYFHIYFQNLVFSYIFSKLNIFIYIVKT